MTTQVRPRLTDEPGVRFCIANAALVTALLVAGLIGFTHTETAITSVTVVGVACAGLSTRISAAMGVVCWAMFTGFIENAYGQLTFAAGDTARLAVFVVTVLAVADLAHCWHLATEVEGERQIRPRPLQQ